MGNESLRQLAQDYALGRINKHDYRHQRHQLIDEITTQNSAPEQSTPKNNISADITPSEPHTVPVEHASKLSQTSNYRVIIAVAVIAIVIIFVTMATSGDNQPTDIVQTASSNQNNAHQLAVRFMNHPEWTSERVSEFVAGWQSLSEAEKQQAHESPWFKDFTDTLKKRLDQQQTLAKTGSERAQLNVQTIKSLGRLLRVSL